jgi:hypothetical protein
MARVPMRVVYWGRWADSSGEVGPISATCVAWVEGGTDRFLPGGAGMVYSGLGSPKSIPILEDATMPGAGGPANREPIYRIAILEVQQQSLRGPEISEPPLPPLPRQIEGPAETEAA